MHELQVWCYHTYSPLHTSGTMAAYYTLYTSISHAQDMNNWLSSFTYGCFDIPHIRNVSIVRSVKSLPFRVVSNPILTRGETVW